MRKGAEKLPFMKWMEIEHRMTTGGDLEEL